LRCRWGKGGKRKTGRLDRERCGTSGKSEEVRKLLGRASYGKREKRVTFRAHERMVRKKGLQNRSFSGEPKGNPEGHDREGLKKKKKTASCQILPKKGSIRRGELGDTWEQGGGSRGARPCCSGTEQKKKNAYNRGTRGPIWNPFRVQKRGDSSRVRKQLRTRGGRRERKGKMYEREEGDGHIEDQHTRQ